MKLKILYFAQLREKFGLNEESVDVPVEIQTISDLINYLSARGDLWRETFSGAFQFRVSMNQEMVSLNTKLVTDAEVGIFRPVTGG